MLKLGIDIGASHIGLGIYDSKKNILIKKKYLPYKNPSKIFNKILTKPITKKYIKNLITNIDKFIADYKIEYIGLGCPGGVDPKNAIFYGSKALVLGKINFKEELKKYQCPVYVDNDCNCAAIGEAINNDYDKFLMITIGTGVGFALIKKKKGKILLAKDEIIWKIENPIATLSCNGASCRVKAISPGETAISATTSRCSTRNGIFNETKTNF